MFTSTLGINYDYDEDEDILYVIIGKPTPSVSEEIEDGILIRRDIKTNKLTGVTILDYKDRIKNNEKINIPKEFDLSGIRI
nr:MAG TPA: Protein of unknown function (DUF2283) [Caudoviricetes sp.]